MTMETDERWNKERESYDDELNKRASGKWRAHNDAVSTISQYDGMQNGMEWVKEGEQLYNTNCTDERRWMQSEQTMGR